MVFANRLAEYAVKIGVNIYLSSRVYAIKSAEDGKKHITWTNSLGQTYSDLFDYVVIYIAPTIILHQIQGLPSLLNTNILTN